MPSKYPVDENIPLNKPLMLLAVTYDGKAGKALLKLYDPEEEKIYLWHDNTGHKPYFYTDLTPDEIYRIKGVVTHKGFYKLEVEEKYDLLHDKKVKVTKVIARDPLSVGGSPGCLRDIIARSGGKVWEAKIKYHNCYIYDRQLIPGMFYIVTPEGELKPAPLNPKVLKDIEQLEEQLKEHADMPTEEKRILRDWLPLFETPVPDIKRLAIDIEVYSPYPNRLPEPHRALYPVICVAMVDNKGFKRILVLKRNDVELGNREILDDNVEIKFYDDEYELIGDVFKIMSEYPVILTFNGDNFDLQYLYHRALKLGFKMDEIPLIIGRDFISLKRGVHIDLYKFFSNRSIQVYAFKAKYRETTLDAISKALLNEGKIELDRPISELPIYLLAKYCLRDAELTLKLTTFNNNLTLKLMLLFIRISKMSIEDLTRHGISTWIKNLLYYEHRRKGYLIPEQDELLKLKGIVTTKAIIKGKKYMGAIVLKPKKGCYFRVYVLDFASLYPSIIKKWNLSYETIRCPHEECKSNKVPETTHWVCMKRRGLMSIMTGLLRDMRVYVYKRKAKDKSLPEELRAWYDVVQSALKVFINASYGVFGSDKFPLYCPSLAESITAIGRYAIRKTLELAQKLGLTVIYGDTDSLFIHNPDENKLRRLIEIARETLGIDLEVDKVYRYVALSRKKNYLGVLEDGTIDVKGLVGKKRNTPEFLKQAFNKTLEYLKGVQSYDDFKKAQDKIMSVIEECYMKLKKREYSLIDLAFKVMLSKPIEEYTKHTPPHVKAAKQLLAYGEHIMPGDIIAYVKVRGGDGVKPVKLARIDEIDESKYLEYVKTTFEQIIDALGIDNRGIWQTILRRVS